MIVNVYGLPQQSPNTINLLGDAARFYASILLEESIIKDIELDIEICYDTDFAGYCVTDDAEEYPKSFTITINPDFTHESIFDTLAHEMVHLKQFATGELYNVLTLDPDELFQVGHVWKGERYECKPGEFVPLDAPWEVEAYGRQVGLYYRWQNREVD